MVAAYLIALASATVGQTSSVTHSATYVDGLTIPGRLAATTGGGIYVTDQVSDSVLEYDAAGVLVNTFSVPEGPVGIAVRASDGQVFVSRADGTVAYYDASMVQLGTLDATPMTMSEPNDMAMDDVADELYVIDSGSNQVMVFDATAGTLVRAWGVTGSNLAEFVTPQAIALDTATGNVIVTDTDNFRVQVFNTAGVLQSKFGYRILFVGGAELAWFARSEGLALDACGNIYIADALMGTVRVFDSTGVELDPGHLASIGFGTGVGQLRTPSDLMISGGKLYVVSARNAAVEVYDVACTLAATGSTAANTPTRETAKVKAKGHKPVAPDNPYEMLALVEKGEFSRSMDLNADNRLDFTDLDMAAAAFGLQSADDLFGAISAEPLADFEAPHVLLDLPYACGRCHAMNGLPDGMMTTDGQENLCLSCHTSSGVGNGAIVFAQETGMIHPIGVAADSGVSHGPDPNSANEIALHLDNGNIRCGTCHNPHNNEGGAPYVRDNVRDGSLCGECHEQTEQWLHAGHSDPTAEAFVHYDWSLPNRASCRRCHSGSGFVDYTAGLPAAEQRGEFRVHDCTVCHATHGTRQDETLLRAYGEVELPGGYVVDRGASATCMECHNGRYAPNTGSATPHYLIGGVQLEGLNGITFGATIENSPHSVLAECVDCHMADGPAAGEPGAGKIGGHTFNLIVHDPSDPDFGVENIDNACNTASCHGADGIVAAAPNPLITEINRTAFGDYDGNGLIEGVRTEVQGLLDLVFGAIEGAGAVSLGGYPYWDFSGVVDNPPGYLQTVKDAIWNYEYVDNDGSLGIHNTGYAVGLLQVTYRELTGVDVPDAFLRYDTAPLLLSGTHVNITDVNGGAPVEPGGTFTVDFTIEDDDGVAIDIGDLNRLILYVSGPANNYQRVIPSDSNLAHFAQNLDGSYTYTAADPFPTVYSAPLGDSLDITEGELTGLPLVDGTYTVLVESRRTFGSIRKAGDSTMDFVVANDPLLPPTLDPRQFVLRDSCNQCHLDLQLHGGNRFAVTGCVVCHTAGGEDLVTTPGTTPGVTIMFKDMIHKLHNGHGQKKVAATANGADPFRYEIIGYGGSVHDFSDVGFPIIPAGISECDVCHGGAAQETEIFTNITRTNCKTCHDDIDFVTGTILDRSNPAVDDGLLTEADLGDPAYRVNPGADLFPPTGISHAFGDDSACTACHGAGMLADVVVAHRHSTDPAAEGTGLAVEVLSVAGMTGGGGTYFQAGDAPEITFKLTDAGNDPLAIPLAADTTVVDRMYFMVVGPTTLYQRVISDQRAINGGAVTAAPANWIDNLDGTYTYIMTAGFPADYPAQLNSIGQAPADQIYSYEGGWGQQYMAGGHALDAGTYTVMAWGRRVTPSGDREPMITDFFDVPFGSNDPLVPWPATVNRDKCNACHGVMAFHGNQRENVQLCAGCHAAGAQNRGTGNSIELRQMIHKLHNARNLTNLPYMLGSDDLSHLLITAMPGEAAECAVCHATDDWKNPPVRDNMRTWMVACTSCHDSIETAAHVEAASAEGSFVESCASCHGAGASWSVEKMHKSP